MTGPIGDDGMPSEPGFINGGMFQREDTLNVPMLTINVDSIEEALGKVEASGGKKVQDKQPVGEMGFVAYINDSEGNLVGLWENAGCRRTRSGRPSTPKPDRRPPGSENGPKAAQNGWGQEPSPSASSRRPSRARPRVSSSAYSRSPPTGRPLARRVTRRPSGRSWRARYIAVTSPSVFGLVHRMISSMPSGSMRGQQLADLQLLGTDAFERAHRSEQHVVATVELASALDGDDVA